MEQSAFLPELVYSPDVGENEPIYTFPKKMFWVDAVRQFVNSVAYLMQLEAGPRVCYQIVVPNRKEVRFVQYMNRAVKIPVNSIPVDPADSDRPCDFSLFSAENWMSKVLPTLPNSPLTHIICVVDGLEHDYRIETVLRVLSQESIKRCVRTLCVPGAVMSQAANNLTTSEISANCEFPSRLENVRRFSHVQGMWDTMDAIMCHIKDVDFRPEVKDILVILPTLKLAGQLLEHLLEYTETKRIVIMPPELNCDVKRFIPNDGPLRIICTTPSYIYHDRYPTVTCVIDTCLRKCKNLGDETLKMASKAAIAEVATIVAGNKPKFTHCVCLDSKKYMELQEFDKSLQTGKELSSTILELENASLDSHQILVRNDSEEVRYRKYHADLLKFNLLEDSGQLTQRGRFALATRLSIRSAAFLDSVFSRCEFWQEDREYRYTLFVACMIAVWFDMDNLIFMPAVTHAAIAIQSEFDWDDSLENYLDVIANYMSIPQKDGFTWCVMRGVNYSALLNAVSNVRCLLEAIERMCGTRVPRPDIITSDYVEKARMIDDKRDLMRFIQPIFEDQTYAFYFGEVRNVETHELCDFDERVERTVRQKICHNGTVFINAASEERNGILDKIVVYE